MKSSRGSKQSRRVTSTFLDSPKKTGTYKRGFLFLKAQNTVLNSIQDMISAIIQNCSENEKEILSTVQTCIKNLLNAHMKDVFVVSNEVIAKIRLLLESPHITHSAEKVCTMVMTSAFSFLRLSSLLISNPSQEATTPDEIGESVADSLLSETVDNAPCVVCRICDELVPIDVIEEHTSSCLNAYLTEGHLTQANDAIKQNMDNIAKTYLDLPWPGDPEEYIALVLPILHLYFLLERALNIQADLIDSLDELQMIQNSMYSLPERIEFMDYTKESGSLVKEKIRHCIALQTAGAVLQQTRVSGSSSSPYITSVSISDFNFLKRISSGAYARVFLSQKKKTGDLYAIKVLKRKEVEQKNQVKRVLAEKDILLQFSNPYIVKFYYSIIGRHNLYLVMEYLPGGDLYSLLQNVGCLDEDNTRIYTCQILSALRTLHKSGIIHRDLKPDNILIGADGLLKLTDFGLSHLGVVGRQTTTSDKNQQQPVEDPSLSTAASLVGTPDYIAPEILLNQPHTFTADYWSLGVIVYELLSGCPPFHGETETETHTNILRGKIDFTDMELQPETEDFIRGLLTIDPKKRLGARSFDDIANHPFIKSKFEKTGDEPPFKPDLTSASDTQYFEQRYSFKEDDDGDILEDMQDVGVVVEDASMGDFTAVAVQQLSKANEELAKKYEHLKSPSAPDKKRPSKPKKGRSSFDVDSNNPFRNMLSRRKSHFTGRNSFESHLDD